MPDQFAQLERLLEDASPRPWEAATEDEDVCILEGEADFARYPENDPGTVLADLSPDIRNGYKAKEDAALIVALVNAAPHLIAVAQAAEELQDALLQERPRYASERVRTSIDLLNDTLAGLRAHLGETEA